MWEYIVIGALCYVSLGALLLITKTPVQEFFNEQILHIEVDSFIKKKEIPKIKFRLYKCTIWLFLTVLYPPILYEGIKEWIIDYKEYKKYRIPLPFERITDCDTVERKYFTKKILVYHPLTFDKKIKHLADHERNVLKKLKTNKTLRIGDELWYYKISNADKNPARNLLKFLDDDYDPSKEFFRFYLRAGIVLVRKGEAIAKWVQRLS